MGGRRDTRQHSSSSSSRHRSRHSPRRKAITADEEEFLKQRTKDRRRGDSEDRSNHHKRHRSRRGSPDRRRRHSRSRDRDDRRSKRGPANDDKEEEERERRERHRARRRSTERSSHSNEKASSSARPSSTERSGKSVSVDGDVKDNEEPIKEASPTSSVGGNKIMDKREERRKRLMQLLQGAEIKDPLREEKRVVLQPWQDDELEIDEDEAKKPVVFGLDAMGSVANSILRMENMNKKEDKEAKEETEQEEEDALDKYMEELTAKTGVTVGGARQGTSAAVAAAGMSVMDAAMQNNTIDLDEIEKLNKAEEDKKAVVKKGTEVKEEEEDGTVEDEDEDDEAYYAAFKKAIKEAKKENENAKEIFAPVYEKDEELAPEKPEVFYEEEHDAADDNEDSSSSSDESDDEDKEEEDGKEEGESERNKTALVLKSDIKEEDISRMSYFELAKQFVSKKELPPVDHSKIEYYPIKKNLYKQVREISNMPEHEVAQLRQSNGDIRVRGKHCPRPIKSFAMAGLDVRLLRMLDRKGISTPFPIQMQAIPALLCGRDVIAIAPTGSGKTLAYLLPMVRHVMAQPPLFYNEGPIGLVIAPTRELALQIHAQAEALCHAVDLKCACAYGGGIMGPQLSKLKAGCHILVATPGRLIDVLTLSNGKVTNLRRVSTVTLDEADRMFDMGFEPQISMVLQNINPARQTCMFSATFPPHVEGLARQSLYKPVEIVIGDSGSAATNVKQQVIVVRDEEERFNNLLKLLGEWADHGSIIVFFTKQDDVDGMYMRLLDYGYACLTLHGGQDQQDRDGRKGLAVGKEVSKWSGTIDDFKKRKPPPANILLATSVAARGLDVKHCICVINYTPPDHAEDYVHRVGRTGRAGNVGFAYTLINSGTEGEYASELVDVLKAASQDVPADLVLLAQSNQVSISAGLVVRKRGGFGGRGFTFESSELSRNQQQRQVEMEQAKAEADGTRLDKLKKEEEAGRGMTAAQAAASAAAKAGVQTQTQKTNGPPAVKPALPPGPPPPGQARKPPPPPGPPPATSKKASPPLPKGPPPKGAAKKAPPPPPKGSPPPTVAKGTNVSSAAQAAVDAAKNYKGAAPSSVGRSANGNASALVAVTPQGASNSALALLGGDRDSFAEQLAHAAASVGDIQVARTKAAAGEVVEELEINDYPQLARAKVSNRELRGGIEERTGCRLQIKGQFYQKNAYVPPGCRKLYIEIIGNSAVSCQRAKAECRDVCEEWAKTTLNIPQGRLMRTNMPQRKRRKLDW